MITDEKPVFGNTCGKLYSHTFTIISYGKKNDFELNAVSKIKFVWRPTYKGLVLLALPLCFFFLPLLIHKAESGLKITLYLLAAILAIIALVKMDKRYLIIVALKNGPSKSFKIWHGNVMEAKKVVRVIAGTLERRN